MSQLAAGPGGQGGSLPQHSGSPALDLEYANERLRVEQSRNGQHGNGYVSSSYSIPKGSVDADMHKHGTRGRSRRFAMRQRTEVILVALSAMLLAVIVFCIAVFGVQAQKRCTAPPSSSSPGTSPNPSGLVTLSYAKYQGTTLGNGVDEFLGIRYADPPTRFSAPQYPQQNFSHTQEAFQIGPGCQGAGSLDPDNAEDCLFADVYRPATANPSSKLPVFVFIQGGGLIDSTAHFNGSGLVIASNMGMVTVSFTYRVGMFGFLASSEVQANGSLNNGYLDQHQLLQWVQKEIAQFGGDPNHVVLGGQSAGAGSVVNHLTAYGGSFQNNQSLFHGAIMESQSMPPIRNVSEQQFQYDSLVNKTGCGNAADTLACLRGLPYEELLSDGGFIPYPGNQGPPVYGYNPVIDGELIVDLPVNMLANGDFIKVPTVFGDDSNEGTIFTPRYFKTQDQSTTFMKDNFPSLTDNQLNEYTTMYTFNDTAQPDYWLKASWAYGETRYVCPGIHMSSLITNHSNANVWNWRYNIATPAQQASLNLVSHGSELPAIWGPQYQGPSGPAKMLETNATNTVAAMQGYWVSFIKTMDPNKLKPDLAPTWDAWNGSNRILFDFNGTSMETIDAGQMQRCGYISQLMAQLQQ
ncbi:MAG: hypothetical protein LQ340_003768 [Diploschistes diacapsis]|nr:MAG: hypothetical protein LQ340_003768 [Diploschistes diacapsis]